MIVALLASPISAETVPVFPRHPPLLLAGLAAVLGESGHRVVVCDAFLERLGVEAAARKAIAPSPDLVVLMPNDVARETPPDVTAALAGRIRELADVPVVVAGIGDVRFLSRLLDSCPALDAALVGDPEISVPAYIRACGQSAPRGGEPRGGRSRFASGAAGGAAANAPVPPAPLHAGSCPAAERKSEQAGSSAHSGVPGLLLGGSPAPVRPAVVRDLDSLPEPAWDLVDLRRYVVLPHRGGRASHPILASRGCWWSRCAFCQDLACVKSPDYRVRSPQSVAREMAGAVREKGAEHFLFHDAVFPTRKEWVEELEGRLSDLGVRASWFCMARADAVKPDVLAAMKRCGATGVAYGLESGSEEMLRRMNKGHDLAAGEAAVRWTKEAGLDAVATFIFGFPGETVEMARQTVEHSLRLPLDIAQFLLVKWHQVPEGMLSEGDLVEDWDLSQFDYRGMVFVPRAYRTVGNLKLMRSYAYARFYLRPAFLARTLARVRSAEELRRYVRGGMTLISAMLNR